MDKVQHNLENEDANTDFIVVRYTTVPTPLSKATLALGSTKTNKVHNTIGFTGSPINHPLHSCSISIQDKTNKRCTMNAS